MYSVVLMLAMTSAPDAANFGGHKGYFKGGGLYCLNTCYGCWGSCHGCCGGWTYGCCGGCCGGYWGWPSYACSGCAGYASFYSSCTGCTGGYWNTYSCFGYGIYGGTAYTWPVPYDSAMGTYGYGYPIPANSMPRIENVEPKKAPDVKKGGETMIYPTSPDKAQVVVRLPADAKLYANGKLTNLDSAERSFSTPVLAKGQDYQYVMKIEYARNGKNVTDDKIVRVRAGEVSVVEFADAGKPEAAVSTLKFAVPQGAKVFVENRAIDAASGEFKTPELVKGAEYAYNVRAELNRDGKVETQTQRVVFKAGEAVTVDLMDLGTVRTASK